MHYWKDKRVLITGGSSGLGRALALQLSEAGAEVAVLARGRRALEDLRQLQPKLHAIRGDVSDKKEIHSLHAQALAALGGVDVLIQAASTLGVTPLRLLLDTECEDLARVLETNLVGPFRLTKLILPEMILRGSGVIVNISSDAAVNAYPRWGAYAVSKAALDHLTRIFQAELEGQGVHFLALDPGDMNTPMHQAALPDADPAQLHPPEDSAVRILAQIAAGEFLPLRRGVR